MNDFSQMHRHLMADCLRLKAELWKFFFFFFFLFSSATCAVSMATIKS